MNSKAFHIISITSFVSLMIMGFVGGLSGSLAWIAYSSRVTTAYIGQMLRSTSGLQMTGNNGIKWSEALRDEDIVYNSNSYSYEITNSGDDSRTYNNYLITFLDGSEVEEQMPLSAGAPIIEIDGNKWMINHNKTDIDAQFGTALVPCTSGAMGRNDHLGQLYGQPIYQEFPLSDWEIAPASSYIKYRLGFRDRNIDDIEDTYLAKYVYLSAINITSEDEDLDLSDSIRIHIQNSDGDAYLLAKGQDEDDIVIKTIGKLDLNNDGMNDTELSSIDKPGYYEWDNKIERYYGGRYLDSLPNGSEVQTSISTLNTSDTGIIIDDSNEYYVNHLGETKSLLETKESGEPVYLDITIWIEGWNDLQYGEYDINVNYLDTEIVSTSGSSNTYKAIFDNKATFYYSADHIIIPEVINGTYHFEGIDSTISNKIGRAWSAKEYIQKNFKIDMRFVVPGDEE